MEIIAIVLALILAALAGSYAALILFFRDHFDDFS